MKYFQTKSDKLHGTSYSEVYKKAWKIYLNEKKKSKRRTYIRSAYFKKDKIFLDIFWSHLKQKHSADSERRLKFYKCALILLKNGRNAPEMIYEGRIKFYRFFGITNESEKFVVQVKEASNGNKYLISVFPGK